MAQGFTDHTNALACPRRTAGDRRQAIGATACRLAGEVGPAGLSLRRVALEADVSMGLIQHYFRSKDELLRFAVQVFGLQLESRVRARLEKLPHGAPRQERLLTWLEALLPIDAASRRAARAWITFNACAAGDPGLVRSMTDARSRARGYLSGLLRSAQEAGEIPPGVHPRREAESLLALADGLSAHVALEMVAIEEAPAVLEQRLKVLFGRSPGGR